MPLDPTTLDLPALNAAITGTEFAGHLHHFPTVDSTQNLAHTAARTGTRHGVWIADEQTAGRGRGAHTWHSPAGEPTHAAGLYMTALASPRIAMPSALGLSFRTAIAVQSAIAETTGLIAPTEIDIRWPNDLVIPALAIPTNAIPARLPAETAPHRTGPSRKIGGILIELTPEPVPPSGPALLRYAVIGIGLNLNQLAFPPELDPIATSLRRELPHQPILPREPLIAAILRNLHHQLRTLASPPLPLTTDPSPLTHHSTWLHGKRVRVEPRPGDQHPGYTGTTAGLTPEGFLLVRGDDGQLHTVLSGGLREPSTPNP